MQRPKSSKSRSANKKEQLFHSWLKESPCCITGLTGVQMHHCKGSTFVNKKVLIGHWYCLPLSLESHNEYHSGTKAFQLKHGNQATLWLEVYSRYVADTGKDCPDEVLNSIESLS